MELWLLPICYENKLSELKGKLYNSKELKEEHEEKARSPIEVTPSWILMEVNEEHL